VGQLQAARQARDSLIRVALGDKTMEREREEDRERESAGRDWVGLLNVML